MWRKTQLSTRTSRLSDEESSRGSQDSMYDDDEPDVLQRAAPRTCKAARTTLLLSAAVLSMLVAGAVATRDARVTTTEKAAHGKEVEDATSAVIHARQSSTTA